MKLKPILILVAVILSLVLAAPALAAETDGKIEGSVFNETTKAVVPDQEVILKVYLNDAETESKTGRTDANGQFFFEGLSTKAGYSYEPTVKYQEADYTGDRVSYESGVTSKSVTVTVYDSTTSLEGISFETVHTIVYMEDGALQVKTYALVGNPGVKTYIGARQVGPDQRETLTFNLPKEAADPLYGLSLMSCCVIPSESGFFDTMAVLPGSKEITYGFTARYDSDNYILPQKFDYPVGRYDLLVEGDAIRVANSRLTSLAPVTIEGMEFKRYGLDGLAAGEALDVELSGLPDTGGPGVVKGVGLGFIGVAAVFGVFLLLRRNKAQPAPVRVNTGDLANQRQKLILEIARLDDDFAAGKVAEDVYRAQRAEKKARLLKHIQSLKGPQR